MRPATNSLVEPSDRAPSPIGPVVWPQAAHISGGTRVFSNIINITLIIEANPSDIACDARDFTPPVQEPVAVAILKVDGDGPAETYVKRYPALESLSGGLLAHSLLLCPGRRKVRAAAMIDDWAG